MVRKDQFNSNLEQVVETIYSDVFDVRSFLAGLVQSEVELVDENSNLTTPTIQITAETSIDGVNWKALDFDSGEKTTTTAAALALLLDPSVDALGMYLRFKIEVGGTGYETEAVDPDDNAYWNVNIKTVLNDKG